jgi:putative addiction module component (TIGR02574 family)
MTPTATPEMLEAESILDRAMKLPPVAREHVGLRLLESIEWPPEDPEEAKTALRAELQRRMDAIASGTMKTYTIEETMAYLRQESAERNGP